MKTMGEQSREEGGEKIHSICTVGKHQEDHEDNRTIDVRTSLNQRMAMSITDNNTVCTGKSGVS